MKFLHYTIMDGNLENKKLIGHCAMSEDGVIINGETMEELEVHIKFRDPNPEIIENCGWVLQGEQQKLLDPKNADTLRFNLAAREARLKKAQENGKIG